MEMLSSAKSFRGGADHSPKWSLFVDKDAYAYGFIGLAHRESTLENQDGDNQREVEIMNPLGFLLDPRQTSSRRADDEDPVDLKPEIEEDCKPKCAKPLFKYNECKERVEKDTTGEKHCTGQYFDFWSCIDKCAANKTFSHLK